MEIVLELAHWHVISTANSLGSEQKNNLKFIKMCAIHKYISMIDIISICIIPYVPK